jgi:hypothetical protein
MVDAGIYDGDTVIVVSSAAERQRHRGAIDGETTLKRFINRAGKSPYLKPRIAPTLPLSGGRTGDPGRGQGAGAAVVEGNSQASELAEQFDVSCASRAVR